MTKTITIKMTMAMTKAFCRELKAENERLKARMGKGDVSEEELKDMAGKEVIHSATVKSFVRKQCIIFRRHQLISGVHLTFLVQSMSKKELEEMKKQWMEEMKANMKNNEKVKISFIKCLQ